MRLPDRERVPAMAPRAARPLLGVEHEEVDARAHPAMDELARGGEARLTGADDDQVDGVGNPRPGPAHREPLTHGTTRGARKGK